MTSEAQTQQEIRLAASAAGCTLFRNNVGQAWSGSRIERLSGNRLIIHDARPVQFGLCVGSSDLVGWKPVTVTQDMVGATIAAFVAIEVKAPRGRATDAQMNFIAAVIAAGGRAGIARSTDDLRAIVKG